MVRLVDCRDRSAVGRTVAAHVVSVMCFSCMQREENCRGWTAIEASKRYSAIKTGGRSKRSVSTKKAQEVTNRTQELD